MSDPSGNQETLLFRLCPRCGRAVPIRSDERYCANDGARLLEACRGCGTRFTSPYARFCAGCGRALVRVGEDAEPEP